MLERVQRMPTRLRLPCMHATFCCRRAAAALSIPCALSSALRPHSFCQTGWVERRCQRKRGCSHTGATRSEGICMVGRTQGPCRPRRCSGMHNAMQMGGCFHNGTAEQQACRAQVWPSLLLAPVLIACCEVFTLSKFAISRDRLAPIGPSCPRVPCLDAAGPRAVGGRPHADPYRVPDTSPGSISSTLCSTHGCQVDSGPWEAVPDTTTPAPPSARMEALARVVRHSQAVLRVNPGARCTSLVSPTTVQWHTCLSPAARLAVGHGCHASARGRYRSMQPQARCGCGCSASQQGQQRSVQSSLTHGPAAARTGQRADACAGSRTRPRSCGLCAHSATHPCEARSMR